MNAPWLFAEAYKYRRLHEAFSVSRYWRDYDVFYRQKVLVLRILSPKLDVLTSAFSVILSRVRRMPCLNCLCVLRILLKSLKSFLPSKSSKLSALCS